MVNVDDLELDEGIKEVVTLLQENGIDTFSSCEGGDGHAFDMPTVRINFDADVEKIAGVLIENGYSGFYVSKHWAYGSDVVRSNDSINFIQVEFWVSLKSGLTQDAVDDGESTAFDSASTPAPSPLI